MNVKEFVTAAGRKFTFGYAALGSITLLCAVGTLGGDRFEMCFGALIGAVMAANYGEHREKMRAEKAAKEVKPDAPVPAPPQVPPAA